MDCTDDTGYVTFELSFDVRKEDLPMNFCLKVADAARNYSPPKLFNVTTNMTLLLGDRIWNVSDPRS